MEWVSATPLQPPSFLLAIMAWMELGSELGVTLK